MERLRSKPAAGVATRVKRSTSTSYTASAAAIEFMLLLRVRSDDCAHVDDGRQPRSAKDSMAGVERSGEIWIEI